jgi:hypothetical protein
LWELQRRGEIQLGKRVAIVGGGITGLTAAAAFLSRFGEALSLSLFEQRWDLCPFQQGSDHRWLHPKIYDWPTYGSRSPGASLPVLNWSEGRASDVARTIINEFAKFSDSFCKSEDQVSIYLGLKNFHVTAANIEINWTAGRTKHAPSFRAVDREVSDKVRFDTIVLAPGFGLERGLTHFPDDSYWRNDQLGQPILDGSPKTFIISGFGDGALIDLCRLTIERYRQDTILYELFSDRLEEIEQRLRDEWRDAGAPSNAFEFFNSMSAVLSPAKDELQKRIRKDTTVFLHIAGKNGEINSISDIFGSRSSFQNRMMAFLLFTSEAFSPTTDTLNTVMQNYGVSEDNVLRRYGTDTLEHVNSLFTDVEQVEERLKQMKANQQQAPELFWEPGSFPQYS